MILYHGSNVNIDKIDLAKSRPYKDFGKAFYLSADESQALEMAAHKVEVFGGEPIVTRYTFDENLMISKELKIKTFNSYSKEWADFIFANRKKSSPVFEHDFDIVYGPIANDSVGEQVVLLKGGYIDFDLFLERLKFLKGITFQYAFCTEKAIQNLISL